MTDGPFHDANVDLDVVLGTLMTPHFDPSREAPPPKLKLPLSQTQAEQAIAQLTEQLDIVTKENALLRAELSHDRANARQAAFVKAASYGKVWHK